MHYLDIFPVNHAIWENQTFKVGYTFKKRNQYISQIDWVLISTDLFRYVRGFHILSHTPFCSNHAALVLSVTGCVADMRDLLENAQCLGIDPGDGVHHCKAVRCTDIDREIFLSRLPEPGIFGDFTDFMDTVSKYLIDTCRRP